jgi:hypothetical protein
MASWQRSTLRGSSNSAHSADATDCHHLHLQRHCTLVLQPHCGVLPLLVIPCDSLLRASFEPHLHWYPHRPRWNWGWHYCRHVLVPLRCYRPLLRATSPEPPPTNHQHGKPCQSLAAVGVDITTSECSHGQSVWPTCSQCSSFSATTKGQNLSLIHQLKMEQRTACSLVGDNRVLEFETDSLCPLYFTEHQYLMAISKVMIFWCYGTNFPIPIAKFTEVSQKLSH